MRNALLSLCVASAGLLFSPQEAAAGSAASAAPAIAAATGWSARGDLQAGVRFDRRGIGVSLGYRSRSHSNRYRSHCCEPRYRLQKIWVPHRYETRIVGYDHCGHAIERKILVRRGYWRTLRVPVNHCRH